MRKLIVTVLAAALTLTACGRDSGAAADTATAKDISAGKATGTITVWAMGAEGEKLPALAKDFEAANPGAKVNVTAANGDRIAGTLAYRDEFTIALTDASGVYRSFPAGQVKFTIDDPLQAHSEQLGKYTDDDMHNVLAYLQTLR